MIPEQRGPQSYRSPTSYIFFSPRREKTLAIYFNINKRIPKEKSALVILDFSNPLAARGRDASKEAGRNEQHLPSNSHWQSCVPVFSLVLFHGGIRDSFHRRRRLSHPPLRPACTLVVECWRTKANNVQRTKRALTFFPSDSRLKIEFLSTMRHGKLRAHF